MADEFRTNLGLLGIAVIFVPAAPEGNAIPRGDCWRAGSALGKRWPILDGQPKDRQLPQNHPWLVTPAGPLAYASTGWRYTTPIPNDPKFFGEEQNLNRSDAGFGGIC